MPRRIVTALAVTGIVSGLGILGSPAAVGHTAAAGSPTDMTVAPARIDYLRITVRNAIEPEQNGTYSLFCHPAGGSHPQPRAACDAIDSVVRAVTPASTDDAEANGGAGGTTASGSTASSTTASSATASGPFAPVPKGTSCTMIHGGPATARITGFWHGQSVHARFDRSNGCEMSRWNSLVPALPSLG